MTNTKTHEEYLQIAIEEGKLGMNNNDGGPFGAIIIQNGEIIGRGHNRVTSTSDPTAHAEICAIRDACKRVNDFHIKEAIIYTSCEPCPMCLSAIYWANIKEIYYSSTRYDAADIGFDDDFIYKELDKNIEDRDIKINKIKLDTADELFTNWKNKIDKINY